MCMYVIYIFPCNYYYYKSLETYHNRLQSPLALLDYQETI